MNAAEKRAEIQAKRDALRAKEAEAHEEQELVDLEILADLEAEHGYERVKRIDIGGWKPGCGAATMVIARIPLASESYFKRFEMDVSKAKPGSDAVLGAHHQLARVCLVYPTKDKHKDLHEATFELAPGLLSHIAHVIVKAVQGKADEEKKD